MLHMCSRFGVTVLRNQVKQCLRISSNTFCDNKDGRDDDSKSDEKIKAAKKKLLSLLSEMMEPNANTKYKLDLSKPNQRIKKKKNIVSENEILTSKEMMSAVKDVASVAHEGAESIEAELTESIQSINLIQKDTDKHAKIYANEDVSEELVEEQVSQRMMSAVKEVAASVSLGDPEPIKSELTKKLLSLSSKLGSDSVTTDDMTKLFEGMKVDYKDGHRKFPSESSQKSKPYVEKIDIFLASPLNIFTTGETEKAKELPHSMWTKFEEKRLKSLVQFAPTNAFEEMIQWTEQGKLWKFPIDNQADMGAEEEVGFHEHVFLEQHLEGFPTKGPIRHFMELVATGLSKNPYISAERKRENIEWFRQYFKEKEHILKEYGVLDVKS